MSEYAMGRSTISEQGAIPLSLPPARIHLSLATGIVDSMRKCAMLTYPRFPFLWAPTQSLTYPSCSRFHDVDNECSLGPTSSMSAWHSRN